MNKIIFLTWIMSLFTDSVMCQDRTAERKEQFNIENGIGIKRYDPVAYFKQNKPVKGKKDLSVYYQGVVYYFSTVENQQGFKKDPSRYEPQYGGWCAYAMGAKNEKVSIDPATFKIIDGKLYLFYNSFFNNTLNSWNKKETELKNKADINWHRIYH